MTRTTPEAVAPRIETTENLPPAHKPHKGSLLTTLTEIVSERMSATDVTVQQRPATLTPEQQLVAYMSEPVIPVRSDDGRVNSQDLLDYWYHHKDEWPALTRLALSYLSCTPSSVTSERVFSRTGSIVSKKRCALLPGNIGRLAFIKFNYKKFEKLHSSSRTLVRTPLLLLILSIWQFEFYILHLYF